MGLDRAVGPGQPNVRTDVLEVQRLLNRQALATLVAETGTFDLATSTALSRFQEQRLSMYPPSARVEPGSSTWFALSGQSNALDTALLAFESQAVTFAQRFIGDARVRGNYVLEAQRWSASIRSQVANGGLTLQQGAEQAAGMRNALLDAARLQTSDLGRAVAQAEKALGKTFPELLERYASRLFGRAFSGLSAGQQDRVFAEIIRASGSPSPQFTNLTRRLDRIGRGLLIVSVAFATYSVATSDRMGREAVRQGVGIGAGVGGSIAGGAIAGLVCGPGAPICVGVGALVGGIAFAVGVDITFDWLWR